MSPTAIDNSLAAPSAKGKVAYATLLSSSSYLPGLLVLINSLAKTDPKSADEHPLILMIVPKTPDEARALVPSLSNLGVKVIAKDVDYLKPTHVGKVAWERFADVWTKLSVLGLTEYERVVLLDTDMLVLQPLQHLFDVSLPPLGVASAHACTCNVRRNPGYPEDWIPANCGHTHAKLMLPLINKPGVPGWHRNHGIMNSGMVVTQPSEHLYTAILRLLDEDPITTEFKFADQDAFAHVFSGVWREGQREGVEGKGEYWPAWHRLPYVYNALAPTRDYHREMWRDGDVRNIHYILNKPWQGRVPSRKWSDDVEKERAEGGGRLRDLDEADRLPGKDEWVIVTHGWWWSEWEDALRVWKAQGGATDEQHRFMESLADGA